MLTQFNPMLHCYTPESIRKPLDFLFSGGIAMQNWTEMD